MSDDPQDYGNKARRVQRPPLPWEKDLSTPDTPGGNWDVWAPPGAGEQYERGRRRDADQLARAFARAFRGLVVRALRQLWPRAGKSKKKWRDKYPLWDVVATYRDNVANNPRDVALELTARH